MRVVSLSLTEIAEIIRFKNRSSGSEYINKQFDLSREVIHDEKEELILSQWLYLSSILEKQNGRAGDSILGHKVSSSVNYERNPLLNHEILLWTKLKAFADDSFNFSQVMQIFFEQKTSWEKKKCGLPHFFLFLQCFQKTLLWGSS